MVNSILNEEQIKLREQKLTSAQQPKLLTTHM